MRGAVRAGRPEQPPRPAPPTAPTCCSTASSGKLNSLSLSSSSSLEECRWWVFTWAAGVGGGAGVRARGAPREDARELGLRGGASGLDRGRSTGEG